MFARVEQLMRFPETGSFIPELRPMRTHRQVIVRPSRIFYRYDAAGDTVRLLGVMRRERLVRD